MVLKKNQLIVRKSGKIFNSKKSRVITRQHIPDSINRIRNVINMVLKKNQLIVRKIQAKCYGNG